MNREVKQFMKALFVGVIISFSILVLVDYMIKEENTSNHYWAEKVLDLKEGDTLLYNWHWENPYEVDQCDTIVITGFNTGYYQYKYLNESKLRSRSENWILPNVKYLNK